jgi:site-specific DNA-cytosine methylase
MRALGAYIFAGGFTVGVKRAGFDVTCHLEGSNYGVPTAKANWPELPVHFPEAAWPTDGPEVDALDFVYCNPPCAVFSPMGIVTTRGADSWRDDPRTSCWHHAFGLLERKRPRAWACESVPQAYTRGRPMIDDMTRRALEMGYSVTHLLLDAKWTGIPQSRKRFFLVCHRPSRLTGHQFNYAPPPTVGDVLATVPEPGHRTITTSRKDWYHLIENTPPGDRVVHTWERFHPEETRERNAQGKVKGRPSFQDRRLRADEVMGAWVGDKFYHPTEHRHIGVNEAKAICGYPPEFIIAKSDMRGFGSLLARAVMPTVGEWLGRAVAATLGNRDAEWSDRRVTLVDVREPDVAPVDLTGRYLTKDGATIPPELREAIGPGEVTVCDADEDEVAEEEFEVAGSEPTPTLVAPVEIRAMTAKGTSDGDRKEDRGAYTAGAGRVPGGPGVAVHRPAAGDTGQRVVPRKLEPAASIAEKASELLDHIVDLTGIDRDRVKKTLLALRYRARHEDAARVIGITVDDVERIALSHSIIIAAPAEEEHSQPTGLVSEALPSTSPAGKPVATAAQVPPEPVMAGTSASLAGTSGPVPPASKAAGGETSEARPDPTPAAVEPGANRRRGREPQAAAKPPAPAIDPATLDPSEVPLDGEGSGAFIRRMLALDRRTPEEIVGLVLAGFENRKTTVKDVAWNWNKMASDGSTPPPWRGAKPLRPNAYPGMKKSEGVAHALSSAVPAAVAAGVAAAAANFAKPTGIVSLAEPVPPYSAMSAARALARVAIVDWFPRVCGATDYAGHLRSGFPGLELVSCTRSGSPVKGWQTPWSWRCLKASDAARALNEYDAVVMTDIACLSPHATEKNGLPWYADVLAKVTVPMTAVFHGGMQYKKDYDPAIGALFAAPGFTGSIVTVRDGQARERLKPSWPGVRLVVNPCLPYDPERAARCRVPAALKTREVMMSARLASNKGQNALLAMADDLEFDAHVWGENPYGLPSIAWRLYELGNALGYREDGPPKLRRDHLSLTHPNAPKFYTGEFAFTTPSGRRYAYHDGYQQLHEADWSPWLHLSIYTPNFGGLLEYTILDAVHAGAVVVVPEAALSLGGYDISAFPSIPFEGSTLWSDEKTGAVKGNDFDRKGVAAILNGLLHRSDETLDKLRAAQLSEVRARHDAAVAWRSVEAAIRGEGSA